MKLWIIIMLVGSVCAQGVSDKTTVLAPVEVAQSYLHQNKEVDLLFFAPDEGRVYKNILLGLIEQERESIKAALFRLTDKTIMNALIDAHKRGVSVEIVFDSGAVTGAYYSLAFYLRDAGVPVYRYQSTDLFTRKPSKKVRKAEKEKYQTLMHQKTFIFKNSFGRSIVAFGSLNPTTAGFYGNEEAMQIRSKKEIITGFEKQFEKLKNRSHMLEPEWSSVRKTKRGILGCHQGFGRPSLLQSLLS